MLNDDEQRAFEDIAAQLSSSVIKTQRPSRSKVLLAGAILSFAGLVATFTFSIPLALVFLALTYVLLVALWKSSHPTNTPSPMGLTSRESATPPTSA